MTDGYSFIEGEQVRLWNGKMYPRARVEQEMTGLSDYANEHNTLIETAPSKLGEIIARTGRTYLCIGIVFGAVLILATGELLVPIVVATLIVIGGAVLHGIPSVWIAQRVQRGRRTISVNNGYVIFRLGRRNVRLPLDSFQWYRGRARHDLTYNFGGYPNVRALVLVTRLKFRWFPAQRCNLACGFTPEMRSRWEAFLTLADVPYGRRGLDAGLVANLQDEPVQDDSEVTCDGTEVEI